MTGALRPIRRLLVANRGEIACRIMRTAKRLGITTIAVHSDADAAGLHVRSADRAIRIGTATASESYLLIDAILAAAREARADAIHPGYGFLSENPAFAEACAAAGIVFVGPPASAIRAMGDKARSKALMIEAGVPVVPGYEGEAQDAPRLGDEAVRIGMPLLIKASAGGGGRGMRRVRTPEELPAALVAARAEARSAFGDDRLLLERLVEGGRHVEIQVFADGHGNTIHLGERDCSTQRRHQKIVEEAPSPAVDAALRARMGADAVRAAEAVGYVGAGTVEFMLARDGRYFFLEMNTRLQVEHPVTEMITGFDLVEWQLRVAAGEKLPVLQADVAFTGHAIEARLYAEDPAAGFRPQTGSVLHWPAERMAGRPGVRVDAGIDEGDVVSPHYDPMIAKVVAAGATRAEAIERLLAALEAAPLLGVVTNRRFLIDLLRSPEFRAGDMTTDLVDEWIAQDHGVVHPEPVDADIRLAAAVLAAESGGDWFRSAGAARVPMTIASGDAAHRVHVSASHRDPIRVESDDGASVFAGLRVDFPSVSWDGGVATAVRDGRRLWLDVEGRTAVFEEPDPFATPIVADDQTRIVSPVTGLLRQVHVAVGERVSVGQPVATIEAMKMETSLAARVAGVVVSVRGHAGRQVAAGDLLAEILPDAPTEASDPDSGEPKDRTS